MKRILSLLRAAVVEPGTGRARSFLVPTLAGTGLLLLLTGVPWMILELHPWQERVKFVYEDVFSGGLGEEEREIRLPSRSRPEARVKAISEAWLRGPRSSRLRLPLAEDPGIRAVFHRKGEWVVDFDGNLAKALLPGAADRFARTFASTLFRNDLEGRLVLLCLGDRLPEGGKPDASRPVPLNHDFSTLP